jgi:hypothetical protein
MADPILGEQQFIPNALTPSHRTRFYRDPVSGILSAQYSTNGGANWKELISQPPSVAAEGWIPTLGSNGNNIVWRPFSSFIGSQSSGGLSMAWADFSFPGTIYTEKEFGYFVVPSDTTLSAYGAQISIFSQATGSDIIVGVVNVIENTAQTATQAIVLAANQVTSSTLFSQPILMQPGSQWRLKILQTGSQSTGEYLSCRLLFRQA